MEVIDSFDKKPKRLFSLGQLSLYILTPIILWELSQYLIYLFQGYIIFDSTEFLVGSISILLTYLIIFIRRQIWYYYFTFVLVFYIIGIIDVFFTLKFSFYIGGVSIKLFGIILLFIHIALNAEYIKPKINPKEKKRETDDKIQFFEKQFDKKSITELKNINQDDLVEEAKIALENILRKRNS